MPLVAGAPISLHVLPFRNPIQEASSVAGGRAHTRCRERRLADEAAVVTDESIGGGGSARRPLSRGSHQRRIPMGAARRRGARNNGSSDVPDARRHERDHREPGTVIASRGRRRQASRGSRRYDCGIDLGRRGKR